MQRFGKYRLFRNTCTITSYLNKRNKNRGSQQRLFEFFDRFYKPVKMTTTCSLRDCALQIGTTSDFLYYYAQQCQQNTYFLTKFQNMHTQLSKNTIYDKQHKKKTDTDLKYLKSQQIYIYSCTTWTGGQNTKLWNETLYINTIE